MKRFVLCIVMWSSLLGDERREDESDCVERAGIQLLERVPLSAEDFFKYTVCLYHLRQGMEGNNELFRAFLSSPLSLQVQELGKDLFSIEEYYRLSNFEDCEKKFQGLAALARDSFLIGLEMKKRYDGMIAKPGGGSVLRNCQRCTDRMMNNLKTCKDNYAGVDQSDYRSFCLYAPQKAKELIELIEKVRRGQKKRGQFVGEAVCQKIREIVCCFTP